MCGAPYDVDRSAGLFGRMDVGEAVAPDTEDIVQLELCGFPMAAIVAKPGSPIREQGFDVLFVVCSADCANAVRLAAGLDALERTGALPDPTSPNVEGLRRARPEEGMTTRKLERMAQFEALLCEGLPAVARRFGADRPMPRYGPEATAAERERVESRFLESCAWCMATIDPDAAPHALFVRMDEHWTAAEGGRVMVVAIGGRIVPAHIAMPGSEASEVCDAVIVLCSAACGEALRAAAGEDGPLTVTH
jgi:hypothetical protein